MGLFCIAIVLVALYLGACIGRQIHFARGFEAGAHTASRVLREAIKEGLL